PALLMTMSCVSTAAVPPASCAYGKGTPVQKVAGGSGRADRAVLADRRPGKAVHRERGRGEQTEPAIDVDDLSGHMAGLLRGQEEDHRRDVGGIGRPTQRIVPGCAREPLVVLDLGEPWGAGEGRRDRVDP